MIDDHLVLTVFIVILSAPGLISARHVEGAAVLLESPRSTDFLAVELSIVHDEMLAEVLLFEVCEAVAFDPPLQNEFADVVVALASDDLTCSGLEGHPSHGVLLTVLLVVALPHGVGLELIRLGDVVTLGRDAARLGHRVAGDWHVGDGGLHHGLGHWLHHWLLHRLLHHWLAHWLHHRLPHGLHQWLAHWLHHRLLLHHQGLLLHHHRLLLHLVLRLLLHLILWLLLLLGMVGGSRVCVGRFCAAHCLDLLCFCILYIIYNFKINPPVSNY